MKKLILAVLISILFYPSCTAQQYADKIVVKGSVTANQFLYSDGTPVGSSGSSAPVQTLEFTGNTLGLSDGNAIDLSKYEQTVSISKDGFGSDIITLTNGGAPIDLGNISNYYNAEQVDGNIGDEGDILGDINTNKIYAKSPAGTFSQISNEDDPDKIYLSNGTSVAAEIGRLKSDKLDATNIGTLNGQSIVGQNVTIQGIVVNGGEEKEKVVDLTTASVVGTDKITTSLNGEDKYNFKLNAPEGGSKYARNLDGSIKYYRTPNARIDYNASGEAAFLVEPEATNYALYNNTFEKGPSNTGWQIQTGVGVSPNTSLSTTPFGGNTADVIISSDTNSQHFKSAPPVTLESGQVYTFSIFVKRRSYTFKVQLYGTDATFGEDVWSNFNIDPANPNVKQNGPGILNSKIEPYIGDWFRISVTATSISSVLQSPFGISLLGDETTKKPSFLGSSSDDQVIVCYAQLEKGSKATSPIQENTGGSSLTRSDDDISLGYGDVDLSEITSIIETVDGIENTITTIPATYRLPYGRISKVEMFTGSTGTNYIFKPNSINTTTNRNISLSDVGNIVEATEDLTYTITKDFNGMKKDDYVDIEVHNGANLTIATQIGVKLNYIDNGSIQIQSEIGTVNFTKLRKRALNEYIIGSTTTVGSNDPTFDNSKAGNNYDNSGAGANPYAVIPTATIPNSTLWNSSTYPITEGSITDAQALTNKENLNQAMLDAKAAGSTTFILDNVDAFFNVVPPMSAQITNGQWEYAIIVPADMTLLMGPDCHLRVQTNNASWCSLLTNGLNNNVNIKGGYLYGDRDTHIVGAEDDEHGYLLDVIGLENGLIENVTIKDARGDGININEKNFAYASNNVPTRNVRINKVTLDNNRRNNMSITAGREIIVENSLFLNAGKDNAFSLGTFPKLALDIEPYREADTNGDLIFYERAENITIRNNVERGSNGNSFWNHSGRFVTMENNEAENTMGLKFGDNTIIRHNTLTYLPSSRIAFALGKESNPYVDNNEIYLNKVVGFDTAMAIEGGGFDIHDNEFLDFGQIGFQSKTQLDDTRFYKNTVSTNDADALGIVIFSTDAENILIEDNIIKTNYLPFRIFASNENDAFDGTYKIIFRNNDITDIGHQGMIGRTTAVLFEGNTYIGGFRMENSKFIKIDQNTITGGTLPGIQVRAGNSDVILTGNIITSNLAPIQLQSTPTGTFTNTGNTLNGTAQASNPDPEDDAGTYAFNYQFNSQFH